MAQTGGNGPPATDRSERFLCDVMLGRLARWLRTLGYDTAYDSRAADPELLRRAACEQRLLLTRDTRIAPPPGVRRLLIRATRPAAQLRELAAALAATPRPRPFSRCTLCNEALRPADPERVAERVPDFVRAAHADFRSCPACGRVYWPGTHRQGMERELGGLFPEIQEEDGG